MKVSNSRRKIVLAGLAVSLPGKVSFAQGFQVPATSNFVLPQKISDELYNIYGHLAYSVSRTKKIKIQSPEIAENGQQVPVNIKGEKGLVSSLAVFAEHNTNALVAVIKYKDGSDLASGFRVKLNLTGSIYVIAETAQGLVGVSQYIRVTTGGCGG